MSEKTNDKAMPPKPEVILTNFFAEPTVLLVRITSRDLLILEFNFCCLCKIDQVQELHDGNCDTLTFLSCS
jgi:hypothetical protein